MHGGYNTCPKLRNTVVASSPPTMYVIGVVGPQKQPQLDQPLHTPSLLESCITAVCTASNRTMVIGPAFQVRHPAGSSLAQAPQQRMCTGDPTAPDAMRVQAAWACNQPQSRPCKPDRQARGPTTPQRHCIALASYSDQHHLSGSQARG
jgi:hypothetical protein